MARSDLALLVEALVAIDGHLSRLLAYVDVLASLRIVLGARDPRPELMQAILVVRKLRAEIALPDAVAARGVATW